MPGRVGTEQPLNRLTQETLGDGGHQRLEEGLRILARLIARAYLRDQVRFKGNGVDCLSEIPIEESDPINPNMEQ